MEPRGLKVRRRSVVLLLGASSDQGRRLATGRGEYRDITDPSRDQGCRIFHLTAAGNSLADFAAGFDETQGVGCEACHGPGGVYGNPVVMADRESSLRAGGRIPDEITCRNCHRHEAFRFPDRLARIRYGG